MKPVKRARTARRIEREAREIQYAIGRLRRALFPTAMEILYDESVRAAYVSLTSPSAYFARKFQ